MFLLKISAERVSAAAILYHDNITMALMKRGGPGSILHSIMLNIDCVYDMHFVLQWRDETSVASINQWVTRSDSKNMVVS